ncbi:MAG: hypothetical protein JO356_07240, partial [Acidobacteria bacterium]|nr:hypothetical protein [Acidobacteriota bacterium]
MLIDSSFGSATLVAWLVFSPFNLAKAGQNEVGAPSPKELVQAAVANEVASSTGPGLHFMFRDTRKSAHLVQTKLIVETRDATAGLLIAQNGRPLTANEEQAEEARLEHYIQNPAEL